MNSVRKKNVRQSERGDLTRRLNDGGDGNGVSDQRRDVWEYFDDVEKRKQIFDRLV